MCKRKSGRHRVVVVDVVVIVVAIIVDVVAIVTAIARPQPPVIVGATSTVGE